MLELLRDIRDLKSFFVRTIRTPLTSDVRELARKSRELSAKYPSIPMDRILGVVARRRIVRASLATRVARLSPPPAPPLPTFDASRIVTTVMRAA